MSVILLVEDFEPLRVSTAMVLRQMGHHVLEAQDADTAMSLLRAEAVDFLFTDVALPDTAGDVLAAEACSLRPSLKVVFGTGLTQFASAAGSDGPLTLRKPYTRASLTVALGDHSQNDSM